jgi:hypothetical protein
LLARNAERLDSVATSILEGKGISVTLVVRKSGGTATAFPIDLADSDAIRQLSARITSDIGTPDVLINNAGAGGWLPFDVTTVEEAGTMLAVPYPHAPRIGEGRNPDPSSPRQFCPDCIIATPGYDFREGQGAVIGSPLRVCASDSAAGARADTRCTAAGVCPASAPAPKCYGGGRTPYRTAFFSDGH